jgi:hypothetical protein
VIYTSAIVLPDGVILATPGVSTKVYILVTVIAGTSYLAKQQQMFGQRAMRKWVSTNNSLKKCLEI